VCKIVGNIVTTWYKVRTPRLRNWLSGWNRGVTPELGGGGCEPADA